MPAAVRLSRHYFSTSTASADPVVVAVEQEEDDDLSDTPSSTNTKRLSQYLADIGLCSRREAERLIREKRVSVAGQVITSPAWKLDLLATTASSSAGTIAHPLLEIDGVTIRQKYDAKMTFPRLWAVLKLKQEIMSAEDPQKTRSLLLDRVRTSILPEAFQQYGGLKPIYRLDYMTEGLALLTNHGELARLMESQLELVKHYRVRIHGLITESKLQGLRRGLVINGKKKQGMKVEVQHTSKTITWLKVSTTEKQSCKAIQQACKQLYLDVTRLICVGYGPYHLDDYFPEKSTNKVSELRMEPSVHAAYLRLQNTKPIRTTVL